jgi:hypothetical protein
VSLSSGLRHSADESISNAWDTLVARVGRSTSVQYWLPPNHTASDSDYSTSPARRSGYGRPLLDCAGHIAGAAPSGNHCSPCEARRPARCAENARSSAARPLRLRPLRSRLLAPLMSLQHLRPRPPVPVAPVPHSRDQRPSIIARPISTRSAVRSPFPLLPLLHLCFQACWITSRTSGLRKSS